MIIKTYYYYGIPKVYHFVVNIVSLVDSFISHDITPSNSIQYFNINCVCNCILFLIASYMLNIEQLSMKQMYNVNH